MVLKVIIYEAMIPEHKRLLFEKAMTELGINFRDTGFYRISDLDSWMKGSQKQL